MQKGYYHFVREVYSYCDENRGEKALLPVFVNLWEEEFKIDKKDLTAMTSRIINRLVKKEVLIEIPKYGGFHVPYGLYEILNYEENLTRQDDLSQKRTKLFK
jgi:hypothetical protein